MTVIINDGSMAAVLGKRIAARRPVTVMTNNAAVIETLSGEAGVTLIALGGLFAPILPSSHRPPFAVLRRFT